MLRLFQKPVSDLSAAIKTALSETQPPKRNMSQQALDLGLNEKPLGTSFAMIWFRQRKTSAKHSNSLGTPGDRAGRAGVSPALWLAWSRSGIYTGTYRTLWRLKSASKWQSWESCGIVCNGKLVRREAAEHPPTWKSPSPMAGHQAGLSLTPHLPHDYPYLSAAQTEHRNTQNSTPRCCASTRTTAVIKRVKDLLPNITAWCYLHGEGWAKQASEAVFFAEIFFLKRRL